MWLILHQLRGHTAAEVFADLRAIPARRLALSFAATVLGYLALAGYDLMALRSLGRRLALRRVVLAAFQGYAFANSLPLAVLVGGAVRRRYYGAWGVSAGETAAVIAFNVVTYTLGLLACAGVALVFWHAGIPASLSLPHVSLRLVGAASIAASLLYIGWCFHGGPELRVLGRTLRPAAPYVAVGQLVVSVLDWTLSGAAMYALIPTSAAVGFGEFFGVFILGQLAALLGQLPGGLGVFDAVVLGLLAPSMRPTAIAGALLAYRIIYYLLPLMLATALLGARELRRALRRRRERGRCK